MEQIASSWVEEFVFIVFEFAALLFASPHKKLNRMQYFFRVIFLSFMSIALLMTIFSFSRIFEVGSIEQIIGLIHDSQEFFWIRFAGSVVCSVLWALWSVHRIQDIGWSRWWLLLLLVPIVDVVLVFILLLKRGRRLEGDAAGEALAAGGG